MNEFPGSQQEGGNHATNDNSWLTPGRFCLILAVLIIIPFHKVLLGGQTFVFRDFGIYSYPLASFVKESFWRGEIPLWNPMSYCGTPFLAQYNTISLYPLSLVYCLLPLTWALPFFCLLHTYFGGVGMFFLARRWCGSNLGAAIAGIVFAFNGLSLNMLTWPCVAAAYALMPWTVFFAEAAWKKGGRHIIIAGIIGALQIFTGSPEAILLTWMFMVVLSIIHVLEKQNTAPKIALRFVVIGIIGAGLAAPAWLPFLDFVAHSQRDSQFAGSAWSMPLSGWANFFVPIYQTQPFQGTFVQISQYWTSSYYVGVGTIFLAVVGVFRQPRLRAIVLGIAALFSVLLAFGDAGLLYAAVRRVLPVVGMSRYPVKFIMLTAFVVPLLAAYAIAYFETRKRWSFEWLIALTVLALVGVVIFLGKTHSTAQTPFGPILSNALWRICFLIAALIGVYLFSQKPEWRRFTCAAIIILTWADLITHLPGQNPTVNSSFYQQGLAKMKVQLNPAPALGQSRLMLSPQAARVVSTQVGNDPAATLLLNRVAFTGNLNLLDGYQKVDGFFPLKLKQTEALVAELGTPDSTRLERLEYLLSVSQTIEPGKVFDWIPRKSYLPMISAGQQTVFASAESNLTAVLNASCDVQNTVYLPLEAKGEVKAAREPNARIVRQDFGYNTVSVLVDTPAPAITFVTQSYYHNWKAYVDGAPTKLWIADYAFQAVEMPSGKHELKIVYEDTAFRLGLGLFLFTSVACVAVWILGPKRNNRATAPA
jgi:hypothetical protein